MSYKIAPPREERRGEERGGAPLLRVRVEERRGEEERRRGVEKRGEERRGKER